MVSEGLGFQMTLPEINSPLRYLYRDQSRVETVIQPRNRKDTFYIETVWFLHQFETNPWQDFSGQTLLIWQLHTVDHPPFYSKGAPTPAE